MRRPTATAAEKARGVVIGGSNRQTLLLSAYSSNAAFRSPPTGVYGNPLRLTMTVEGGSVELRSPAALRVARLEESLDLATWTVVMATPTTIGDERALTLTATSRKFYRPSVRSRQNIVLVR
jgi:hypothetical protein